MGAAVSVLLALIARIDFLSISLSYTVIPSKMRMHNGMDNLQEECSVQFTLAFHANCAQMQYIESIKIPIDKHHFLFVTSFIWTLDPWNGFKVAWH